jgi:O-antigen ligase
VMATATGSAEERWGLLKDGIYLTLRHPLFGVGPGDFQVAQADLAVARGESRGAWRVTHNSYTQISSEMGIPGLVIYLVFLYRCFESLNSIARSRYPGKDWQDLRALAMSLRASFVVVLTIAFFDSYAYDTNIPILAGLACALSLIAQRQRALLTATPPQGTPALALSPEPSLEPA